MSFSQLVEPNFASNLLNNNRVSRWFSSREVSAVDRPVIMLMASTPPLTAPQIPPLREMPGAQTGGQCAELNRSGYRGFRQQPGGRFPHSRVPVQKVRRCV